MGYGSESLGLQIDCELGEIEYRACKSSLSGGAVGLSEKFSGDARAAELILAAAESKENKRMI